MKCNNCHSQDTKVIESRDAADSQTIRRRRQCMNCQQRFTTYERIERPPLIVVKNNGNRELFNRAKLQSGLYRASEKTPVTSAQLDNLVNQIEQQLQNEAEPEVTSATIGDLVMDGLANLNEVAYVRFASVYRRFKDIAGFERELLQIRERKTRTNVKD